ncbi:MAG: type 1 glutamine amidotransferase [Bdellovibrionales bacterium]|nr:type 1 glutamine amidotransferase [Bdellovibrionales bacterium]
MKVLVIDNTLDPDSWGSADLVHAIGSSGGTTIIVRRAPHEDLPENHSLKAFDRIVLSGSRTAATEESPWISKLDDFIRSALDKNIPLLGICYGHQAIARVLGSDNHPKNVRRSATPEIGWTEIIQLPQAGRTSPLFEGLPQRFHSFSVHYDEVCEVPRGATLLARSERCAIQAFSVNQKPVFGIQFHPERGCDAGERTLAISAKKKLQFPLLHPGKGEQLYSPEIAKKIFENFIKGRQ